ncbi:MAG: TetR family transcriptional regulator [Polyangiaceae bacterium]|nr:TetR family transcriptional regulator [Polyangiaceae bacterium]
MTTTKQRLLAALAELAEERPLDRIAIIDVAERAGVSRPTVVRHLGDKQRLRRILEETRGAHAPESLRERLVHLALAQWGTSGEGAPSVAELAAAAGVAKSSISWHFSHKRDLLVAIAEYLTGLYDTSGLWGGEGQAPARGGSRSEGTRGGGAAIELRLGVDLLLRRRLEFCRAVPRTTMALAWLRRAGPEDAQTLLDESERDFRRGVAEWLSVLARRRELEPGNDIEAWIAVLETLLRDLEQRPGQLSWADRIGALLVTSIARRE